MALDTSRGYYVHIFELFDRVFPQQPVLSRVLRNSLIIITYAYNNSVMWKKIAYILYIIIYIHIKQRLATPEVRETHIEHSNPPPPTLCPLFSPYLPVLSNLRYIIFSLRVSKVGKGLGNTRVRYSQRKKFVEDTVVCVCVCVREVNVIRQKLNILIFLLLLSFIYIQRRV